MANPRNERAEAELERLDRAWPGQKLTELVYSHFCTLPMRFAPAFPRLDAASIDEVTLFCHLFVGAVLAQDPLLDRAATVEQAGAASIRVMALQHESMVVLQRLFPPASPFWTRMRAHLADHAAAFAREEAFRSGRRPLAEYDEPRALEGARHKIGLARIAVAAMAELDGDDALLQPITTALGHVGEAIGLEDDVRDWREDLQRRQPSWLLHRVLAAFPRELDPGTVEEVGRAIYLGGHGRAVLEQSLRALDQADQLRRHLPALPWYEFTGGLRANVEARLDTLRTVARERLGSRRGRVSPASPWVRPWTAA